jgi:hypothetical protein
MRPYFIFLLSALFVALIGDAAAAKKTGYTLKDVQGYWWDNCGDPAAQFAIQGNVYFGDFAGQYKVRVKNDTLIIDADTGTSMEIARSLRIVSIKPGRMILRNIDADANDKGWVVRFCP